MKKFIIVSFAVINLFINALGQEGIKPNYAAGEVLSVNQEDKKIVVQTSDGTIEAILSAETAYKKVPPENPVPSAATSISVNEISAGDKVLVTGKVSPDKKTISAKTVYLITKSDIARKQEREREEWRTRGISGRVISLDVANKKIIISTRGMMGERLVTITPKENAEYRRYAPDSIKFSDAKLSSYAELKVGDQLRALGDRSPDGSNFTAEKIVFGSFKTAIGKITAIDLEKRELKIKDVLTDKEVTVVIKKDATMKKFPAEIAAMFLARSSGTFQPPQQRQGEKPAGNQPERPQFRGGDLDDMLERFPNVSLEELKVGDAIAISSTVGEIPNRLTAIKLLSGVEPFLEMQQAMQARRNANGQTTTGFTIPGLDGISFP